MFVCDNGSETSGTSSACQLMVEKCRNRAHAAALSLLPTLQVKNFDFSQIFSDALSDAVRGKPLGKQ